MRGVAESNTQLMQIADDIARWVKASHACSLMVVNDEMTSLRLGETSRRREVLGIKSIPFRVSLYLALF